MCRFYVEVFMFLIFIEISLVFTLKRSEINVENQILEPPDWQRTENSKESCLLYNCTITCFNGLYENLELDLTKTLSFTKFCTTVEKLQLQRYEFPNATVPKLILGQYQKKVRSLIISNSNIVNIEYGAFQNGSFEQLILENLKLPKLRASYFENMSDTLISLTIIQNSASFEDDFLWPVKQQLKVLRIHLNANSVQTFIPTGGFENLINLNLKYNNLANRLKFFTFMKFNALEYLNLSKSKISFLPSLIFSYLIETLVFLDISGNHLNTIWPMIFGYQQIPPTPTINALDNPFVCSCQLYNHFLQLFPQMYELYCKDPDDNNELILVNIGLCFSDDDVDRNLQEETSTIGTALTTEIASPEDFCNNLMQSTTDFYADLQKDMDLFEHLLFLSYDQQSQKRTPHGIIFLTGDEYYFYKVIGNNIVSTKNETLAFSNINFEEQSPYTVCIIYEENIELNPLDCTSSYKRNPDVDPAIDKRSWLTVNHKITIISIAVSFFFAFMFIGVIITFVIVLKRPSLIESRKQSRGKKPNLENFELSQHTNNRLEKLKKTELENDIRFVNNYGTPEDFVSMDSCDSYMCDNIYELVPSYLKLREEPFKSHSCAYDLEDNYNRLPPIDTTDPPTYSFASRHHHISMRDSNDPIPLLPPPPPPGQVPTELNNIFNHMGLESEFNGKSDIYDF